LWTSLPTPYPSFRFAELGNGVGYYLPRLSALGFRVGKVSWLPVAFLENQCQKEIFLCSPVSQLRVDSSLFVFDQCDQCSSAVRFWVSDHGDHGGSPRSCVFNPAGVGIHSFRMSALTSFKDSLARQYQHSPTAFWVWILLILGGIAAYAYLKTGG